MAFLRKKPEIIFHIAGWILFLLFPVLFFNFEPTDFSTLRRISSSLILPVYFYLNMYLFVPLFLNKKKYLIFIISMLAGYSLIYFSNILLDKPEFEFKPFLERMPPLESPLGFGKRNPTMGPPVAFRTLFPFLFVFTTSTFIRLFQLWQKDQKQQEMAEQERVKSELSYLKLQISPHFLYNSLNSIYSLAVSGSDKTAELVLKLSELTRYMTYTSENKYISVEEELEHLENFIELQRIRLFDDVIINFSRSIDGKDDKIEPMLLIPFIENAFKHGISYSNKAKIDIQLEVKNRKLYFIINNQLFKSAGNSIIKSNSGIGLPNVKRRLELLYPQGHQLEIIEEEDEFRVKLYIELKNK